MTTDDQQPHPSAPHGEQQHHDAGYPQGSHAQQQYGRQQPYPNAQQHYGQPQHGQQQYGQQQPYPNAQQHYGQPQYGQQQYGQPYVPAGMPLSPEAERQLVCAAHWSPIAAVLLGGLTFFGPLIVLLVGGHRSQAVRQHAVDALNFQITVWIVTFAAFFASFILMLVLVGFLTVWLAVLVPIAALCVHAYAAVKVAAGEDYRYPFTWHLIK